MNYPIYISSSSDDEEDDVQEPTNSQQPVTTIVNDERRIYQAALQDLNQPKTEKDLPHGVLSVPLMRHQKIALEWMRQKERSYNNCLGAILADDQGLGKTISIIALILFQKLKSQSRRVKKRSRRSGGTLVVCPASVVKQWAKELDDKVSPQHKLSVLVYHGSRRTNDPVELAKYDVVVTTYALVTNEVLQTQRRFSGALGRVRWSRVVLDEAQTIKNHKTQVARACSSLNAKRRWCLSGTPIQNEVMDLFSYFKFLRYHPYAEICSFSKRIMVPIKNNRLSGYKKLQAVLRAILLRQEFAFYKRLEASSQSEFEAYAAAGAVYSNYAYILVMLLRLRQACDHPWLVKTSSVERVNQSVFTSTKINAVMKTLESLGKQVKTLVFSQWTGMLDLVEHSFVKSGVTFRRLDGTMSLVARDKAVKEFNNDPSVQVMLMSLKAGNLGLNMVSASHVIILDLWWNPTTEDQAIDRAHRIGQTRAVTVTRIAINNTVEDRILALQETKRIVVASALGEDSGELSATRLTEQDLGFLFFGVKQEHI
ncbi:hypothetical protein HID58_075835 [Brassica napus]|uniref:Uncharacterized protein n=1 Tax=Brassica napus TaxID=3708 RepID=A0ABQ7YNF8_BRANA|nr:hypothetical protein HID58_075835 [Brassica napus]